MNAPTATPAPAAPPMAGKPAGGPAFRRRKAEELRMTRERESAPKGIGRQGSTRFLRRRSSESPPCSNTTASSTRRWNGSRATTTTCRWSSRRPP